MSQGTSSLIPGETRKPICKQSPWTNGRADFKTLLFLSFGEVLWANLCGQKRLSFQTQ